MSNANSTNYFDFNTSNTAQFSPGVEMSVDEKHSEGKHKKRTVTRYSEQQIQKLEG